MKISAERAAQITAYIGARFDLSESPKGAILDFADYLMRMPNCIPERVEAAVRQHRDDSKRYKTPDFGALKRLVTDYHRSPEERIDPSKRTADDVARQWDAIAYRERDRGGVHAGLVHQCWKDLESVGCNHEACEFHASRVFGDRMVDEYVESVDASTNRFLARCWRAADADSREAYRVQWVMLYGDDRFAEIVALSQSDLPKPGPLMAAMATTNGGTNGRIIQQSDSDGEPDTRPGVEAPDEHGDDGDRAGCESALQDW